MGTTRRERRCSLQSSSFHFGFLSRSARRFFTLRHLPPVVLTGQLAQVFGPLPGLAIVTGQRGLLMAQAISRLPVAEAACVAVAGPEGGGTCTPSAAPPPGSWWGAGRAPARSPCPRIGRPGLAAAVAKDRALLVACPPLHVPQQPIHARVEAELAGLTGRTHGLVGAQLDEPGRSTRRKTRPRASPRAGPART